MEYTQEQIAAAELAGMPVAEYVAQQTAMESAPTEATEEAPVA